jgi:hypothetical protein
MEDARDMVYDYMTGTPWPGTAMLTRRGINSFVCHIFP